MGNRVVAVRSRRQGRPVPAISLTFPTKDQPNEKTSNTENKFMVSLKKIVIKKTTFIHFFQNLEQNEETWNKYNMPSKRKTNLKNMYYGKTSSVVTPWGNGRDWNNPPAKVGGWINLLPLYLPSTVYISLLGVLF